MSDRVRAVLSITFFLATTLSYAADVFVPPNAAEVAASAREQARDERIERLEKSLAMAVEALGRTEKNKQDAPKPDDVTKLPPAPFPMPSPLVKVGSGPGAGRADAGFPVSPLPEVERVIGVVNGDEIYVLDGVVRRREVSAAGASSGGTKK